MSSLLLVDFDGVFTDIRAAVLHVSPWAICEPMGLAEHCATLMERFDPLHSHYTDWVRAIYAYCGQNGLTPACSQDEAIRLWWDRYLTEEASLPLIPGAIEALTRLSALVRSHNGRLVIITNRPDPASITAVDDCVGQYVDAVYNPSRTGQPKKPSPGMLLHAYQEFGTSSLNTLMIGDGANDYYAARAAAIGYCELDSGLPEVPPGTYTPDHRFKDLAAFVDWFTLNMRR